MTTLRIRAEEYLAMRRRLGFKLTTFGTKLMSFVDYLDALGATTITTDSAVAWATGTRRSTDEVYWSRRLMVIRINTVVEKQRCAQCQPHQHFQTVVCPLCGDGPMVAGDLADLMPDTQAPPAPVLRWLAEHGWRDDPDEGRICADHPHRDADPR
jgi:hypothetical protein